MPKGKETVSFADLGFKAQAPLSHIKTKAEKKYDKLMAKKDKHRRVNEAIENLSKSQDNVAKHREFVEKKKEEEKREKQARKMELEAEHIKARAERTAKETADTESLLRSQAEFQEKKVEEKKELTKQERAMQEAIWQELEEKAKHEKPAVHVTVQRDPEIQATRLSLPVLAEEQPIMEAVEESKGTAVIVCGETGSGKTTQVPQFLWEAGYGHPEGESTGRKGMIAVTEPRRVAAISMAKRVAEELNVTFGGEVCYHVRYDNNLSPDCKLKFLTEGVLLKELQSDFLLRKYSAIVVDEAHERSVACDILVGLLSRLVPLRQQLHEEDPVKHPEGPLKLIIMSATMRVADFRDNRRLFPRQPSLINVEVRRFPVSSHYARTTELFKYVDEAYKKVRQVHKKLPPGGILIFLSTQREIESLVRRLKQHYSKTRIRYESERYGKHAMLGARRQRDNGLREEDDEGPEADEFGLRPDEYALEGDEDFPNPDGDEEETAGGRGLTKKAERRLAGLRDDFDYADVEGTGINDDFLVGAAPSNPLDFFGNSKAPAPAPAAEKKKKNVAEASSKKKASAGLKSSKRRKERPQEHQEEEENDDEDDEDEEDEENEEALEAADAEDEEDGAYDTLHVLPLYSLLSTEEQHRVFNPPPEGTRLCVIATNVAETSITIPNIRYVVDAGRVKTKTLDTESGAASYRIQWTSQASAEQRAGRAGRTGPGHCYRLYSTAVYSNRMPQHAAPELLRTPLESVTLMMKHMKIDHVAKFPFPTAPPLDAIGESLRHLIVLKGVAQRGMRITPLGSRLMQFPIAPRLALPIVNAIDRALKDGTRDAVLDALVIAAAVASTSTDIFGRLEGGAQATPKELQHPGSDFVTYVRAFQLFCRSRREARAAGIVEKTMIEAQQLKRQLDEAVRDQMTTTLERRLEAGNHDEDAIRAAAADLDKDAPALGDSDAMNEGTALVRAAVKHLKKDAFKRGRGQDEAGPQKSDIFALDREEEISFRQLIATGLIDQVVRRASVMECRQRGIKYTDGKTTKIPYYDYRTGSIVYVHPGSSVSKTHPPPQHLVYVSLQRTRRAEGTTGHDVKVFMKGATVVTSAWLDAAGFDEDLVSAPTAKITGEVY